jgi:Ca-activated chloride channel family protein
MQFANPNMLWLLLIFPPALIAFSWWAFRKRQTLMAQFIQARLLPNLLSGISLTRQKLRFGCLVLAVAGIIAALARPQWGFIWEEVTVRGVDIVVAIDTSKSMLAEDIAPNRLTRAKLAALDLMQQAKSDRLGLVAFAGSAFLECPLTIDDIAFRQSVESLDVNSISQGGTAIAEAIETAQNAFKEGDNHRVLVLMTDGEDQDSGALEAAQKAAQAGLRIYAIGIGTAEGELLRVKDPQGHPDYIRDEQGNVVKSHLNEPLLQQIASASAGGGYLPLRGAKTMDTLYEQGLSKLPKSEHQQRVKRFEERFQWPLGFAIFLLVIEILLPERKRESNPRVTFDRVSKPSLQSAAVLFVMLALAVSGWASPASALREYKAGKYDEALKEYGQLLQRKSDDPRLHFNAGAAAYRNQQFEEATKQFNEAVASPDLKLQELAYYNRGNAQYWLGDKNPDPAKRTDAWEKSLKDYELSLKLNPQDADARFNLNFVKQRLEELKQQQPQKDDQRRIEPSEAAKKAKAEADEAVRQRDYAKALGIMEKQLEQDETTRYYADYIQRLKDVTSVQSITKP